MFNRKKSLFFGLLALTWVSSIATATDKGLVPESVNKDWIKNYSPEQMALVKQDYEKIKSQQFTDKTSVTIPLYLGTAGGPGAGKTTILEKELAASGNNLVYVDPDQSAFPNMSNCRGTTGKDITKEEYEQWRGASNYIANNLLNEAFAQKLSMAHGTTATSPHMGSFYEKLKKQGYRISLMLVFSPDDTRQKAVKIREEKGANQVTPEDVVNKGKMFYDNMPIYFKWADDIQICYFDSFEKGIRKVASYSKDQGLKIIEDTEFKDAKKLYEAYRTSADGSKKKLPEFDSLVKKA